MALPSLLLLGGADRDFSFIEDGPEGISHSSGTFREYSVSTDEVSRHIIKEEHSPL